MTPSRSALAVERRTPRLPRDDEDTEQPLPRRPRRNWLNWPSALLTAIVACTVGFYAGVRLEKNQLASTPRTFSLPSTGAAAGAGGARTGAAGGGAAAGASGARGGAAGAAGGGAAAGAGGARGGFAGAAGGGAAGGAAFGTVQSVNGNTLVLSEVSGNTVKVRLAASTKVSKTQSVKHSAVRPGDTLVVQGAPNAKGTVVASSVTDSGAGGGAARAGAGGAGSGAGGAGSGAGSASSGGGGSAVGSLFSGGGG